jgi:hypothetical protein
VLPSGVLFIHLLNLLSSIDAILSKHGTRTPYDFYLGGWNWVNFIANTLFTAGEIGFDHGLPERIRVNRNGWS